jgi:hypothetical protein
MGQEDRNSDGGKVAQKAGLKGQLDILALRRLRSSSLGVNHEGEKDNR